MNRLLAIATVLVTITLTGAVSGVWSHRWAPMSSAEALTQATQLPLSAGEWDGREKAVSPAELQVSQAVAMAQRQYVNRRTGQTATVLLVGGRSGPISVHRPEVCYAGNGFDPISAATRFSVHRDSGVTFWHLRLKKQAAIPVMLSVYYSWNDGSGWQAAENARVAFAGRSSLFKLYVVRDRESENETDTDESTGDLLRALLPIVGSSIASAN